MPATKLKKCQTLQDLAEHFEEKLTRINQAIVLRNGCDEDRDRHEQLLSSLASKLSELQTILTVMRAEISQRKRALENVDILRTTVSTLHSRAMYVSENLPQRLPQRSRHISPSNVRSEDRCFKDVTNTQQNMENNRVVQKKKSPVIPRLDYITTEEFESVPKYIKGRITYNQVNGAVDELNKAFEGKYKFLFTSKQSRNENVKRRIAAYRAQDNKDSKGLHYVVDGDMKEFTNFKLDSVGRALLTMMRHCHRLKEIRGGGMTRYGIIV